jgi:hypothetical protein
MQVGKNLPTMRKNGKATVSLVEFLMIIGADQAHLTGSETILARA